MIDWLSKNRREEKRKQAQEEDLRASLSEKLKQYEASREVNLDADDDHTELLLNGKKIRVAKQQIDLGEEEDSRVASPVSD